MFNFFIFFCLVKFIFTINNHRCLCVCVSVPHASATPTGPIFIKLSHLEREFPRDDARLFHFSFGALWSSLLTRESFLDMGWEFSINWWSESRCFCEWILKFLACTGPCESGNLHLKIWPRPLIFYALSTWRPLSARRTLLTTRQGKGERAAVGRGDVM